MRDKKASDPVLDDIGNPAVIATHCRFAQRHRLQKNQSESFAAAGQGEYIGTGVASDDLLTRNARKKVHSLIDAHLFRERLKARPVVAISDEHELQVRRVTQELRENANQCIEALVSLGRRPAAHS